MKNCIWISLLIALALFLGGLLYGGETHVMAQDGGATTAPKSTPTPTEASWDEGEPPAPPMMGKPEGKRGPGARDGERGPRPNREGFDPNSPRRPLERGDRPEGRDFRPEGAPPLPPQDDMNHRMGPFNQAPPRRGPFQDWEELEKADPEFFAMLKADAELERTTRQLTMQYRQARSAKAKEELGKQLAETVTKHFEVRQQRRAMELNRLEKELSRLKALYEKRNEMKNTIIEKRIQELKGEEESLF